MIQTLFIVSAAIGLIVGGIQLWKWIKKPAQVPAAAPDPIEDKWVSPEYVEKAGIAQRIKEQGYQLYWATAEQEPQQVDLEGWEVVVDRAPDGSRVRYKHRDHPIVGGYVILLKKKLP